MHSTLLGPRGIGTRIVARMKTNDEFVSYLLDALSPLGTVTAKRMFGGFGLYRQARMFGLVADDVLYLKVDDRNRGAYEERGQTPFTYTRRGKPCALSYFLVPDDVLEDGEKLCEWASGAYDAACRATVGKQSKNRSRGTQEW